MTAMGRREDELFDMIRQRALAAGKSPEEAEKIVKRAVVNAVRETTPAVVKTMVDNMPAVLDAHLEDIRGFDSRIRLHWGRALDLMFVVTNSSIEAAENFRANCEPSPNETLFLVLTGLFARACRIAMRSTTSYRADSRWGHTLVRGHCMKSRSSRRCWRRMMASLAGRIWRKGSCCTV